jgi:WD40-like Beta Propeller Repeat
LKGRLARRSAAALLFVLLATAAGAATRYDPRLRFRTISTTRFDIHFHQGEEQLARRLARIAEEVADRLAPELGRPRGRVHVILVSQTDLSNGFATPIPYNLIEINAVPPPGQSLIGNTDDWLRLVFSHEYTHVVHLDEGRGWIGGLRHAFGRLPLLYPNLFLPQWQIEGLATYSESRLTGEGRIPSGDFRTILDRAAAAGRLAPLDRANGGLVDWPSGNAGYVYGAYFHQYLAARFGEASIAELSRDTSGRIPFLGSRGFRKVFGQPLGTLWHDFQAEVRSRARTEESRGQRLTEHGFSIGSPWFAHDGRLFYSTLDPHRFPALFEWRAGAAPRRVTTRYLGNRLTEGAGTLIFDALELVQSVALQSDLYAIDVSGGRTRRLTRDARAGDPDVTADGRRIACTVQRSDRRDLATLAVPAGSATGVPDTLVTEPNTDFSAPRWAPDRRAIAVERRRLGGRSEIVLVDFATRAVRSLVATPEGRNISPVWTPDGRSVVFASDRDGVFRIYAADVATGATRRLADAGAGAESPAISPDGRTLVYVGSTADGDDLFSIALASATWIEEARLAPVSTDREAATVPAAGPSHPYRPWRGLLPRAWEPVLQTDEGELTGGAAVGTFDPLGYHAYVGVVRWSAERGRPDWQVAYAYDRWRPTLFADVSDDTDPFRDGTVRSREGNAGVLLPFRRVRRTETVLAAFNASSDRFDCSTCGEGGITSLRRRAVRLGWSFDSAKAYGYSISAEEGGRLSVTSETTREAFGARGDADAFTADARLYRRLFVRHGVLAVRAAGATSQGDESARRVFSAGGVGQESVPFRFKLDAIGLLRGFDDSDLVGQHAAVVNLDYRFPIRRVQRGFGTVPVFLRTIHGAVFADAGHAWNGRARWADVRTSVGAELSFDTVVGFTIPLTVTAGTAWRHDRSTGVQDVVAFGRIGHAF